MEVSDTPKLLVKVDTNSRPLETFYCKWPQDNWVVLFEMGHKDLPSLYYRYEVISENKSIKKWEFVIVVPGLVPLLT